MVRMPSFFEYSKCPSLLRKKAMVINSVPARFTIALTYNWLNILKSKLMRLTPTAKLRNRFKRSIVFLVSREACSLIPLSKIVFGKDTRPSKMFVLIT
jgi:hypothetical protein